jgi:hypothetical protein
MSPKQLQLSQYLRRIYGLRTEESTAASNALGSMEGATAEAAAQGFAAAIQERPFTTAQEAALEAVIHTTLRPAVLIQNGTYPDLADPWAAVSIFRPQLEPVIQAIGRVEVGGIGGPFGGTGFLCGPGLMMTNRHVAELFLYGVGGSSRLLFIPQRPSGFENGHEHRQMPQAGLKYRVTEAVLIHPYWDAALLKVEYVGEDPGTPLPTPLTLCSTAPDSGQFGTYEQDIVVIGYPYWSDGHSPAVMQDIFNGLHGYKRLQPGRLTGYRAVGSFGQTVEAVLHDASTLGGNSGSAVIHTATRQVMALHFAGAYLETNYAVPAWELARDPRLVDAGVNFSPAPDPAAPRTPAEGGPLWLSTWAGRENDATAPPAQPPSTETPAPAPGPAPAPAPTPAADGTSPPAAPAAPAFPGLPPLPPSRTPLIDPGWFERYTDEELRRLYQRDPEQFRELLAATFEPEEAHEIYETLLSDGGTEGIFSREPDPALPEIVLIPGILGSHLRGSFLGRSWFNALTLPFSNLYRTLGLDANANDPNNLRPDGYIGLSYSKAARAWRRRRFMVHEFSYDWRLPLAVSARRLDDFLRARRRARPQARLALVCHSMGSLVASIYARDTPDWRDYVHHAVFAGGPLGGSFAIMEMLSGEWPFVMKLASISQGTSLQEMRQMGATFPGALEMLPHPALFTRSDADVEKLYHPSAYAPFARPGADWLRASRRVKADLRDSPLFGRATCLVCVDRPTAGSFITTTTGEARHSPLLVRGDGTVAATSALLTGVPAYKVDFEHGELLKDPKVIQAVPDLLTTGDIRYLPPVHRTLIESPLPVMGAPAPSPEAVADHALLVRERMRTGILTEEDYRWLTSSR